MARKRYGYLLPKGTRLFFKEIKYPKSNTNCKVECIDWIKNIYELKSYFKTTLNVVDESIININNNITIGNFSGRIICKGQLFLSFQQSISVKSEYIRIKRLAIELMEQGQIISNFKIESLEKKKTKIAGEQGRKAGTALRNFAIQSQAQSMDPNPVFQRLIDTAIKAEAKRVEDVIKSKTINRNINEDNESQMWIQMWTQKGFSTGRSVSDAPNMQEIEKDNEEIINLSFSRRDANQVLLQQTTAIQINFLRINYNLTEKEAIDVVRILNEKPPFENSITYGFDMATDSYNIKIKRKKKFEMFIDEAKEVEFVKGGIVPFKRRGSIPTDVFTKEDIKFSKGGSVLMDLKFDPEGLKSLEEFFMVTENNRIEAMENNEIIITAKQEQSKKKKLDVNKNYFKKRSLEI